MMKILACIIKADFKLDVSTIVTIKKMFHMVDSRCDYHQWLFPICCWVDERNSLCRGLHGYTVKHFDVVTYGDEFYLRFDHILDMKYLKIFYLLIMTSGGFEGNTFKKRKVLCEHGHIIEQVFKNRDKHRIYAVITLFNILVAINLYL